MKKTILQKGGMYNKPDKLDKFFNRNKIMSKAKEKNIATYRLNDLTTSQKAAFTLAEVLITLGVIGVVAAMTIPTLISNFQKRVLHTQFKKAYTTLMNAHKMAETSFDYIPKCYYLVNGGGSATTAQCDAYNDAFLKNLRISKDCGPNAMANGCIPTYKSWEEVKMSKDVNLTEEEAAQQNLGCSNFNRTSLNSYRAYYLSDGIIIFSAGSENMLPIRTVVDINGNSGPNQWGYDVFYFYRYFDGKKFYISNMETSSGCMPIEEGGYSPAAMLKSVFADANKGN